MISARGPDSASADKPGIDVRALLLRVARQTRAPLADRAKLLARIAWMVMMKLMQASADLICRNNGAAVTGAAERLSERVWSPRPRQTCPFDEVCGGLKPQGHRCHGSVFYSVRRTVSRLEGGMVFNAAEWQAKLGDSTQPAPTGLSNAATALSRDPLGSVYVFSQHYDESGRSVTAGRAAGDHFTRKEPPRFPPGRLSVLELVRLAPSRPSGA